MYSLPHGRYACYGPNTRLLFLYLANVKTADEMILPTLLQMEPRFASTATCDTTLHFTHWIRPGGSWHPEYLTLEHLPLMLQSHEVFARKIGLDMSAAILRAVVDKISQEFRHEFKVMTPAERLQDLTRYVDTMNWLVLPVVDYLKVVIADPGTPTTVIDCIRDAGDVTVLKPLGLLQLLDSMRRAREAWEYEMFRLALERQLAEHSPSEQIQGEGGGPDNAPGEPSLSLEMRARESETVKQEDIT
eukprot:gene549-591_t